MYEIHDGGHRNSLTIVRTKLDIYVFYYYHWVDASLGWHRPPCSQYSGTAMVYCPPPPQSGAGDMEMPGVRPLVRPLVCTLVRPLVRLSEICCKRSKIFIC